MTHSAEVVPPGITQTQQILEAIEAKIRQASRVQVVGHHRPDGDCYGSILAVHYLLEGLGREHRLAAGEQGRTGYLTLDDVKLVESAPAAGFNPDLFIFVDSASLERALPGWKADGASSINIDHHGSNALYADVNWVDASRASTAEMIYDLAVHLGVQVVPRMADAILLGLMTDTGSFRYSNVGPRQFEIAAELVRAGANVAAISRAAYENRTPEALAVTGAVMGSIRYLAGGAIAVGEVPAALAARVGGPANLPENLSAELRTIVGVRVALLFVELASGGLRLSLRGDGSVNVSRLAARFGGGGHPNAAGLTIENGNYEELRDKVLAAAVKVLSSEAGA